jgi:hypothetical protein
MFRNWLTVAVVVWCSVAVAAAQNAKVPARSKAALKDTFPEVPNKIRAQESNQSARAAQKAFNLPKVMELAQMSPDERAKALAQLAPARRQELEQRLDNFAKWPPAEQEKALSQYRRLMSLPPERRDQVRESIGEYTVIQAPRKGVIGLELNRLSTMTDEQRSEYMSRPAFRGRFSEAEIRMMNDLRGIVP